jgi:hypothetical protein
MVASARPRPAAFGRFPGPPERVIVDHVLSISDIASPATAERAKGEDAVRGLIAATPDLAGRERVAFRDETIACSRGGRD